MSEACPAITEPPIRAVLASCGSLLRAEGGVWIEVRGDDLRQRVATVAAGLRAHGLRPGDRAAILCGSGAEELIGELAIQACGAVFVTLDPGLNDAALGALLVRHQAKQILALDERQLERVRGVRADLPSLELAFVFHPPAENRPSPATPIEHAVRVGRERLGSDPAFLERVLFGIDEKNPVCVVPGNGRPERTLAHRDLERELDEIAGLLELDRDDTVLLGGGRHRTACYAAMRAGSTIAIVPQDAAAWDAVRFVRPTVCVLSAPGVSACAAGARAQGRWPLRRARVRDATGGRLRRFASIGGVLPRADGALLSALGIRVDELPG